VEVDCGAPTEPITTEVFVVAIDLDLKKRVNIFKNKD
jgi:hypothetical protein